MGKYDPLAEHLKSLNTNHVRLTFREIERIIGAKLPTSAHQWPDSWWGNDRSSDSRQCQAWLSAGWEKEDLDQSGEEVSFRRIS